MSITLIIVVITAIVSFLAFSNRALIDKLIFYPPAISKDNEWYRFLSNGLIHADTMHLLFNMFSLYMFGAFVEDGFRQLFGANGNILYVLMYVTSLAACLVPTYVKHKDNYHYRSLGASGAVSAVVFAGLFLNPLARIGLFIIPPIIPGFIFGPIYLFISAYLAKKGGDNINHSAHIWGALYGIAFLLVTAYMLSPYDLLQNFVLQIQSYFS